VTNAALLESSRPIFITEIVQFGGAERGLLALARWLHRHNLPVHMVTYIDHCNLAQYASFPLPVVELHREPGAVGRIKALRQHFAARPSTAPVPMLSGYQPALHATAAGMRGFHTLMFDTPALFGDQETRSLKDRIRIGISNRIIGHGLRSGGKTIVNSNFLRDDSRKDFGVDAIIVRMGGLEAADGSAAPPFRIRPVDPTTRELRMLSVCRIEPNKRIDWMLRSLAELEKAPVPLSSRTDWRLDLAGKGSLTAQLKELAVTLGIADRVHFLGFVSDADLEVLYSKAHIFLMPAVQGYGVPAIESLERGIPVVLHRDSGVSDILRNTPWTEVLTGGPESLTPALAAVVDGVITGRHHNVPLPPIPTEAEWAGEVARLCGWI
jgi:glycosyltransferase involved in cell wall biosynthesis